ncbi:MAG: Type III restriction-modification system methylation subunit [Candidatus Ozemobacter sibiricus]|uniref:Methyltransferase n=1 Tax=Candidatus Ozemobacter sibiricus TaxID=2268124 RepID=A0A367ZLN8_9BACT|nr:MAG: Type III restriction-modification system methylation subunit [Candidatus Ozemobacter sibiricus]
MEVCRADHIDDAPNRLILGDNLAVMRGLPDACLDLIYADPPFGSGRTYRGRARPGGPTPAFADAWGPELDEYLGWLMVRCREMWRLLTPTGSLFVHCDHHAGHYIKVELDRLCGRQAFINEIVWCYKSGGANPRRHFSRKHDVILMYARGPDYYFFPQKEKSYNRGGRPYRFKGVEEFQDERGWYTLVAMKDYWEIDMVGRTSSERTGYPTQKPERLLERIIVGCCPPDGVVGDFFCGSGTTPAVAGRLGRRWIACDASRAAIDIARERLLRISTSVPGFTVEQVSG